MQNRIIIDGNSVYEVDETCMAEKKIGEEGKRSGKYEKKNGKTGCSSRKNSK